MNRAHLATLAAVALSAPLGARATPSTACQPVEITAAPSALPEDWRRSLDALKDATSRPGQPWSCGGGRISLELDDSDLRGTLRFTDATGRTVERHVPTAEELVPTAEALLATLPVQTEPAPPPQQPATIESAPHAVSAKDAISQSETPRRLAEPRVILGPFVGTRYGTPGGTLWGSAGARIDVPFGDWSLGMWGRYAAPLRTGQTGAGPEPLSEVAVGISGGRRLIKVPFELRATIDPSLNVVSEQRTAPTVQAERAAQVARIDLRIGVGLRAAFRLSDAWRAAVGIEGDAGANAAGVGACLGIEAVVR